MRSIEALVVEGHARPKRARRPAQVFDADGRPVLISLLCPHCGAYKPLSQFGLRRMGNGDIRNCPWCSKCRATSGPKGRGKVEA